jgi:AraC-type DNA-binding domain-containing proteins
MDFKQFQKITWDRFDDFNFEIRTTIDDVYFPHYHEWYELSLLAEGNLIYSLNQENIVLPSGTLLFTRPKDIHFKKAVSPEIKLLNIAFRPRMLETLCQYLGSGFDFLRLENEPMSPMVHVEKHATDAINLQFEEILNTKDIELQTTKIRILVFNLLTNYFMYTPKPSSAPENFWLINAMNEMEQKANFIEGIPALLRLTCKTHEHICRAMKKMYGITPTQYINNLRLSHAENLLLHTDMDILSISIDSGFNSLSNFYTAFEKQFNVSPLKFRKQWAYTSFGIPISKDQA